MIIIPNYCVCYNDERNAAHKLKLLNVLISTPVQIARGECYCMVLIALLVLNKPCYYIS